jgi:REP element-mobilizing transposase RayT
MITPQYTIENCRAAYQLNWVLALFWREPVCEAGWLPELRAATEQDGARVLQHRFVKAGVSQLLVSTRPELSPAKMVWSVKGRLQHAVRAQYPKAFRRNYAVRSVGSATREAVEQYVAGQVEHHPMVDPRVNAMLADMQIRNPSIDLARVRENAHARFWYNLHVCFVNEGRLMEVQREVVERMKEMIVRASVKKGHLLSRGGIVPDHIHLTLGCNLEESPAEVVLS